MAEDPFFLEPRHVPDFPHQGVDDPQLGTHELFVGQIRN
jgi:hypothetical protein